MPVSLSLSLSLSVSLGTHTHTHTHTERERCMHCFTQTNFLINLHCFVFSSEVKIVKQMPVQHGRDKPTVAIITFKYYEKMAVDAMMTNKTTFVKYKTEG